MSTLATINGADVESLMLCAYQVGAWSAMATLVDAQALSGQVTLSVGSRNLFGTVVDSQSGTTVLQRTVSIVGGYGGWGETLTPKAYHSDGGVSTSLVIQDAARECGEKLGQLQPKASRFSGVDYIRGGNVPASRALEDACRGATWWVDFAGVTHVGPRSTAALDRAQYEVVRYRPEIREVELSMLDLGDIDIGSILQSDMFDGELTVRQLDINIDDSVRVWAWCGGDETSEGQIVDLMTALTQRVMNQCLYGKYKYRCLKMESDGRVQCQAVSRRPGLPDTLPISQWSAPGIHGELTEGAEVLVEFLEGDRSQPFISGHAPKAGVGHVPVRLELCGSDVGVARVGDQVVVAPNLLPTPQVITLTPLTTATGGGVYKFEFSAVPDDEGNPRAALLGTIISGSPRVVTSSGAE